MSVTTQSREGMTPTGTSFRSAVRLVAEREMKAYLRMKAFWITFGAFVVGLFALAILPGMFGGPSSVAAVGPEAAAAISAGDFEVESVADRAQAEDLVRSEEVDAAIVPDSTDESASGLRVVALTNPPTDVVAALNTAPPVDLLEPSDVGAGQRYIVMFTFALVFFLFAMAGMAIAQSVVTEKQTRIVEILVSTIPVRALLAGKVIGHSLLVFGEVAVLALVAPIALRLGDHGELLTMVAPAIGWFVPFFMLGFVLLACLWAVAGSLVSRQEDLGSSSSLVMMLVMLPYFGVVFFQENETVMRVLSYVPFSAAVAMPVRLFTGDAQAWEPFVALALLAGAVVACILVASRLYSGSLLQTGGRVALAKAWAHTD